MSEALSKAQIEKGLRDLKYWQLEKDALVREFRFDNHPEAVLFLTRLAFEAEAQQHHPDTRLVWAHLRFELRTHDAGNKVTEKDLRLATTIEALWMRGRHEE